MAVRRLLLFEILVCALSTVVMSSSPLLMPPENFHQYFDNFTLSGLQFACSKEEHECLISNTLLYDKDKTCYRVGEQGPCQHGKRFHVDKRNSTRLGGHLTGTCAQECADPAKSPLAATGECFTREEVETQFCPRKSYLRATYNALGEWVCEWTSLPCTPQPIFASSVGGFPIEYNGVCNAPDFLRYPLENITIPDDAPSDHPLLTFFPDQSYREQQFPCTEDEAKCLRYGRVLDRHSGNCCSPLSIQWPTCCENGQTFHLNRTDVSSGRLSGTCKSPCRIGKQPIAGTGLCGDYSYMSKICRWEWGMLQTQDVYNQMVCECSMTYTPPPPPAVTPEGNPGYCNVPDFSNPVISHSYDLTTTLGFRVSCSEAEYACLCKNTVLVNGACYDLNKRGPCRPGELLVMDKEALANGAVRAICTRQPCDEGYVYVREDGSCHQEEEAIRLMCANQQILWDEFGGWQCSFYAGPPTNWSTMVRYTTNGGECELRPLWSPVIYGGSAPSASAFSASGSSGSGSSASGYAG